MNYIIFDAQGAILRTLSCPPEAAELQVGPGEFIVEGVANIARDAVNPETGQVIPGARPQPQSPATTYSQARRAMYPRIEEQLDMLWHAMDSLQIPRAEPFYTEIKAVKDANPKPGEDFVFEVTGD